jgi:hypothetical protein
MVEYGTRARCSRPANGEPPDAARVPSYFLDLARAFSAAVLTKRGAPRAPCEVRDPLLAPRREHPVSFAKRTPSPSSNARTGSSPPQGRPLIGVGLFSERAASECPNRRGPAARSGLRRSSVRASGRSRAPSRSPPIIVAVPRSDAVGTITHHHRGGGRAPCSHRSSMQPVGRKWLNPVSPDAVPLAGSSARVGRQRSG